MYIFVNKVHRDRLFACCSGCCHHTSEYPFSEFSLVFCLFFSFIDIRKLECIKFSFANGIFNNKMFTKLWLLMQKFCATPKFESASLWSWSWLRACPHPYRRRSMLRQVFVRVTQWEPLYSCYCIFYRILYLILLFVKSSK